MTTILTAKQYENLRDAIYQSIMSIEGVDMGEMGEAYDNAEGVVNDWIRDNGIIVINEDFTVLVEGERSTLSQLIIDNTAPDVAPIEPEILERLINLNEGERLYIGLSEIVRSKY